MNEATLIARLRNAEDNYVERKPEGANSAEYRKTVVAFANSLPAGETGVLFVGIGNSGTVIGVTNADSLQRTLRRQLTQICYPPIEYVAQVVMIDGKDVLAIIVSPGTRRPHFAGPAYVRIGSESVVASEALFDEMLTRHVNKAEAILNMRGHPISVLTVGKRLGSPLPVHDRNRHREHECEVRGCTPHTVELFDMTTSRTCTEPLNNVTIDYDHVRGRPLLIVREIPV